MKRSAVLDELRECGLAQGSLAFDRVFFRYGSNETMKMTYAGFLKAIVMVALAVPAVAFADSANSSPLSASACGRGRLVINVTERIEHDVDSRWGGGYWAFADYNRQIQVREVGVGQYCATVQYEGQYTSVDGLSPMGDSSLSPGTRGTFQGGYRTMIYGSLQPSPQVRTSGRLGTTDYQCSWSDDGDGVFEDDEANCPGFASWVRRYFLPGYSSELPYWGWSYHGPCADWVNACDGPDAACPGTSGDIVSECREDDDDEDGEHHDGHHDHAHDGDHHGGEHEGRHGGCHD